ncbi:OLC1v1007166C1 [Oldenlandia corymbosa var. corymbosa]|uniref:3-ketoacyl-CoA synthase n=1 Tax=Oldenlandia corymbosa var. corymbosa TaxID=529605 RepID=A0AAV1DLR0_OLDCO|nr:OLC1v1007166C1 [Oldenlandia corymbosa var. corymbosa]
MLEFINQTTNLLLFMPLMTSIIFIILLKILTLKRRQKVFVVDFSCYKPRVTEMFSKEKAIERAKLYGYQTEKTIESMKMMMDKAGLGDSTYLPNNLMRVPHDLSLSSSREETERVMFGAIDELLSKTKVKAQDIGILVVNCSLFQVVPSLSCTIVNRYKLRDNIASYSLSGMGCTCGLIAVGLVNQLLQVHKNTYALVVSTENISGQYYKGNDRRKVAVNCLFRLGGTAILLSNKPSDLKRSKYQLIHTVQTHTASSDASYRCIFQEEDEEGNVGVTINKDLLVSAANAIKLNLTSLAPLILPLSEKLVVLRKLITRKLFKSKNAKPYIPNFSKGIDHFFPHVGGKPVLDDLQNKLGFSDVAMEASRMTLYRFGNTSSSSVWYALAYAEAKGRIKKGDLLWQMAFGSGFKCSSVIWRAMKFVEFEESNPWSDEIHNFPQNLDHIIPVTREDYHLEQSK